MARVACPPAFLTLLDKSAVAPNLSHEMHRAAADDQDVCGRAQKDRLLATNELDERITASPAISGNELIYRTDSQLLHRDMLPFWPLADGNRFVGLVHVGTLHIGCALAGFFGLVFWVLRRQR